jgi:hypothetical protein
MVSQNFADWALSFSGCDGGDIGSAENKSIWFCGIEWGGGHKNDKDELNAMFSSPVVNPGEGYDSWRENLAYRFNWQAMKLLSALDGLSVKDYKNFAETKKPFTQGEKGYFKMNLFPLAFKDTSNALWGDGFSEATGFLTKNDYKAWIIKERAKKMREWVFLFNPRVIICTGISYAKEFQTAFMDRDLDNVEIIEGQELRWGVNSNNTFVFVTPFMVNRYGLTRDSSIQLFGERMRNIVSSLKD